MKLTEANLGLPPSHWLDLGERVASLDLDSIIHSADPKALLDLHASLFPYLLHGQLNGFMLTTMHVEFLALTMTPYQFAVPLLEERIRAANSFIRKWRKDMRVLGRIIEDDMSLIKPSQIETILTAKPKAQDLRMRLRDFSIGARLIFLGTTKNGSGQGGWGIRPFGIDEDLQSKEVVDAGLGSWTTDPAIILSTFRKDELLAALADLNPKKGWSKKFMVNFMLEKAKDVAAKLCDGRRSLVCDPIWLKDADYLNERARTLVQPLVVALGFLGLQ